jgi:uncharacterized protein
LNESVFLDTSGLYAVFDADDSNHAALAEAWNALVASDVPLRTSNFVLVELIALLQRRLGLAAVDALAGYVLPWVRVEWVDQRTYEEALAGLLAARRRDLSLVDSASFVLMRRLGIRLALTVDKRFLEQGFDVVPPAAD